MSKIAVVMVCDKNYLIGMEVTLFSLLKNSPVFKKIDIVIMSKDLIDDDLLNIKKIHNNIILKPININPYKQIDILKQYHKAHGDYLKYEIFTNNEYENIIYLDVDLLILNDISNLLKINSGIHGVPELFINQFNTGLLIIGKEYLNTTIRDELIMLTEKVGITEHYDQDIINEYFNEKIGELSIMYNFLKIYHHPIFKEQKYNPKIKILHYIAHKPWSEYKPYWLENGTEWQDQFWWEYRYYFLKEISNS